MTLGPQNLSGVTLSQVKHSVSETEMPTNVFFIGSRWNVSVDLKKCITFILLRQQTSFPSGELLGGKTLDYTKTAR